MLATQIVLVGANIALVIVTLVYVLTVRKQTRESDKRFNDFKIILLKQTRNQAEGVVSEIRMKKAEFEMKKGLKAEAMKILEDREKQYQKTSNEILRTIEELKSVGHNK